MGAFDCELAALGYTFPTQKPTKRKKLIEPKLGLHVVAQEPCVQLSGTIVYCSEETVVVRFDKPHQGKWRTELERSYFRPNTDFYLVKTKSNKASKKLSKPF